MNAIQVVDQLLCLNEDVRSLLGEAIVYLPPRSSRWVAVFTGSEPGKQIRRSTGLKNREAALILAKKWEREARYERGRLPVASKKPGISARSEADPGLLTQREVAQVLGMSERGVRAAEKRALSKLRNHPSLRPVWNDFRNEDHYMNAQSTVTTLVDGNES